MERILTYSTENCFICKEFMGSFKNDLTVVTAYSEKQLYEWIENFTDMTFSSDVVEEAGICQNCFIKFNEYDEHKTISDQIEAELLTLFDSSNSNEPDSEIKENIKLESECVEEHMEIFETEEEPQDIEEMFMTQEDVDTNAESTEYTIVEYDWLEQKPADITIETPGQKPKIPKPRPSKAEEKIIVIETENSVKMFQCEICKRVFREKSKLKSHREIHTTIRNVVCPTCGKTFKTQACLRSHKRVHNPVYMFCDFCGKSYTQKPELNKHIKFVHYNIREFFCHTCGAGFGSKGHLSTHMLTHQDQSAKSIVCQVCALAFHTRAKLERHMKSHTKERNYECGICSKKFLYSYNVTAHIKHVHYREKRKESDKNCAFCGKKFQKLWKLREHMADIHQVIEEKDLETQAYFEDELG